MAQENARKTLEAGVTTVRDLGSYDYDDIVMRDLINRGAMVGPRMFVAGCGLTVTSEPFKPDMILNVASPRGAGSPAGGSRTGCRWSGRDQGVRIRLEVKDVTGFQTFRSDEMKAAVEAAHKFGRRIAIHSYGPEGARDAVWAGSDSVEHAIDIADEVLAEMVKRGVFCSYHDHNRYYVSSRDEYEYDEKVVERLNAYIEKNWRPLAARIRLG